MFNFVLNFLSIILTFKTNPNANIAILGIIVNLFLIIFIIIENVRIFIVSWNYYKQLLILFIPN